MTLRDSGEVIRVFAKTPSRNWIVWLLLSVFDPYRNEMNRYAHIPLPVQTPKVYCARFTPSQFVLVLEDLTAKVPHVFMPTIWMKPECDLELAKQVLATLAKE